MELQSVTLYQPEGVIESRLPDDVDALSEFIQRLVAAVSLEFANDGPTSRVLVVALTPDRCAFWILLPDGAADERPNADARLSSVTRPRVVGGPVAFGLILHHDEDFPSTGGPPVPHEWADVAREAGSPLSVDEILTKLQF
jgi:hypothetical protein